MSPLPATKPRKADFAVTGARVGWAEMTEPQLIHSAALMADARFSEREVLEIIHGGKAPRGTSISAAVRDLASRNLEALASHDRRSIAAVRSRLLDGDRLRTIEGTALVSLGIGTGFQLEWIPRLPTAAHVLDYAIALLLDASRGWGARFFRCALPNCRGYFVASPPKRQGQFRYKYCCAEHQKAADQAKAAGRVRRFREKARKAK